MDERLLVSWLPETVELPTLVCLPQAGAGARQFHEWQSRLGVDVRVIGVQLPRREERWGDPPTASVAELAGEVANALLDRPASQPLVLVGLSFGGLLGYEIARGLGAAGRWPTALVVASCRPPKLWVGGGLGLTADAATLDWLLTERGIDSAQLDPDIKAFLLDALEHDARLALTFAHPPDGTVRCPLSVWGGDKDEMVTTNEVGGWEQYAAGPFAHKVFTGGHYFWLDHTSDILTRLGNLLRGPDGVGDR